MTTYAVTFRLDMTGVTGFTQPNISGTFNGWCGNCAPMTHIGNGIWEITIPLNYQYN